MTDPRRWVFPDDNMERLEELVPGAAAKSDYFREQLSLIVAYESQPSRKETIERLEHGIVGWPDDFAVRDWKEAHKSLAKLRKKGRPRGWSRMNLIRDLADLFKDCGNERRGKPFLEFVRTLFELLDDKKHWTIHDVGALDKRIKRALRRPA